MMAMSLRTLLVAAALAATSAVAIAQEQPVELLGEFTDWKAASFQEEGGKGCFMISAPKISEGKYSKRDPTFVHITHRTAAGTRDVVSITAGYTYKPASAVTVKVGDKTFTLFTKEGAAWADDATDGQLVAAMKDGSRMTVQGTSARGTLTTDTYSLSGFSAAYDAISKACPAP
jgi:invasion protein IalB